MSAQPARRARPMTFGAAVNDESACGQRHGDASLTIVISGRRKERQCLIVGSRWAEPSGDGARYRQANGPRAGRHEPRRRWAGRPACGDARSRSRFIDIRRTGSPRLQSARRHATRRQTRPRAPGRCRIARPQQVADPPFNRMEQALDNERRPRQTFAGCAAAHTHGVRTRRAVRTHSRNGAARHRAGRERVFRRWPHRAARGPRRTRRAAAHARTDTRERIGCAIGGRPDRRRLGMESVGGMSVIRDARVRRRRARARRGSHRPRLGAVRARRMRNPARDAGGPVCTRARSRSSE